MLQLQKGEDAYCSKLIRAIEQCVEIWNTHCSEYPIIIKDKSLNAHTVITKTCSCEQRIAILDSLDDESKLRNLVYAFACNKNLTSIFYSHGNEHVWDAVMRYVLFNECEQTDFKLSIPNPEPTKKNIAATD